MDKDTQKKFISSLMIIVLANVIGGGFFVLAFYFSKNSIFLYLGLGIIILTLIAMAILYMRIRKTL
jgi:formate/nitrite transporter FocA (FNT family)